MPLVRVSGLVCEEAITYHGSVGPTWPFGTTQYIMQFMDDAIENGYSYNQQQFTPSYNYIQYQYPHVSQQAFV